MSFSEFIVNYWEYISCGILFILEIIILIVKKRSKTEIVDNGLFKAVCDAVAEAENRFGAGNGEVKLNFVLAKLSSRYIDNDLISSDMLKSIVEYVLTLPTKKGGFGRDE